MPTHDVYARLKAIDTIHQEVVEGELEVVGAEGNSKLFIQHGGRLRELSLTGHLRPEGVRIRPGSPHRIVEQQVEMRGRLFREIAPFVEGERVYLFGSFRLATDRDPRQRVDAVNPVRRFGDLLRLEYASFRDPGSSPGQALEEQGLLVAPIEEGTLLLKFILPLEAPICPVSLGEVAGAVQTLRLKLKSLDELSTGLNGEVRQGEPLARSREAERELVQIKEEIATEEQQEGTRARLFRQEEGRLEGEIARAAEGRRRLQGKATAYEAAGSPGLFAKELKALEEEEDRTAARERELQHALDELRGRREVAALEHRDRLRKLKARREKLAGEVEVKANFSGRVLGMEARHEADHVRVDLTVVTDGQGRQREEASSIPNP